MGAQHMRLSSGSRTVAPSGGRTIGLEPISGVELLEFAQSLCAAGNQTQLERRLIPGFNRLFGLPMYALYIVDPWTGDKRCLALVGVSDSFLARYERGGRELNWMHADMAASGRAAYNMALLESMDEWLENPLYTKLKYLHGTVALIDRATARSPYEPRYASEVVCEFVEATRTRSWTGRSVVIA